MGADIKNQLYLENNDMKTFTEQLQELNACKEAIDWVNGRSLRKCWQVADRSDWMLWLVGKLSICETEQHELACDFAERVLKYVPDDEDRPRIAIETKRRWIKDEATNKELAAARNAAWAAAGNAAGAAARTAAGTAAWAAARDAVQYAARDAARDAAWDAAQAAAWEAARAAAARDAERKAQCRLIRKRIPVEMIEEALGGSDE